jgi:hypothetical protein
MVSRRENLHSIQFLEILSIGIIFATCLFRQQNKGVIEWVNGKKFIIQS